MLKIKEVQEKNKRFFDRAKRFYEFPFIKIINKFIHKRDLKEVPITPNSEILDAGCGTGMFLELIHKKHSDARLYGIDVSEKMLETAKKRLGGKATLSRKSVESLSYKNRFDFIFNIDSFHHYADQRKAMINFYNALRKGGTLAIADFSLGCAGNWFFKHFEPANSRMYLKEEFRELFRKHGLKNIKQKRLGLFSLMTIGEK
ncbi:MAG: methyltransferase domain-containing protein [Nanoarchaeota archaeon]|nr:methyltransferase domain-containing protein [Nanoarchaeota archaeon]